MCRPGLTFVNSVVDGRKFLTDKQCSSPPAENAGHGIIRPESNAPHRFQRAGVSQTLAANAQKVIFHGGILFEYGMDA